MISKFKENKNFIKFFQNTSWLLLDKIITMGIVLFINILIARYLGPRGFGFLSYSI